MKTDLKDVTFMIPVRIDSIIRLENLISVVQYLFRHFDCRIMVLEADAYNNGIIKKLLGPKIKYHFIEDYDSTFYRTKYLNIMTEMSTTPFLAIWDADIIISSSQIIEAIGKLRNEKYDIALPYDGKVLDVPISIRELFMSESYKSNMPRWIISIRPKHYAAELYLSMLFLIKRPVWKI
jgi:hypothetical protein